MNSSKELAEYISVNFIRKLPKDNVEVTLTGIIEEFRLQEINKYVNKVNLENYNTMKNKMPMPKKDIEGIKKVKVWSRN